MDVARFADKVKDELLPLNVEDRSIKSGTKYEYVNLPSNLRGSVKDYKENIYQSPIKTSAGNVHWDGQERVPKYFGHTRVEDMADGKTRRVIEVQSDLYQKGNLEKEMSSQKGFGLSDNKPVDSTREAIRNQLQQFDSSPISDVALDRFIEKKGGVDETVKSLNLDISSASSEAKKLQVSKQKLTQYNDPTAHFRMIREEVKKAAEDGKSVLQFPTGETAMKIEGLGDKTLWYTKEQASRANAKPIDASELKIGQTLFRNGQGAAGMERGDGDWIITDVLGDGKFKAVPKHKWDAAQVKTFEGGGTRTGRHLIESDAETFDISGKVDQNNPIHKFYEKEVGKYLRSKYSATQITDDKGVGWWQVEINKELAKLPVEAFGLLPLGFGGGLISKRTENNQNPSNH